MRKQFVLTGCLAMFLFSCNKGNENTNENTSVSQEQTVENFNEEDVLLAPEENKSTPPPPPMVNSPIQRQEKLIEKSQNQPLTNIAISENHYDFKEVKKGQTVSHRYEFTNTGKKPLIISAVVPGCGCTAPEYSKEPIMPGQNGFVTLTFDSTNFQGIQRKAAEVYANVEQLPIVLTFSANVITE